MSDNNFRSAIRSLVRYKGYTGINMLGLTLGLCTCLVIFNIVSYEFSFDRNYPDRDRIYRVGGRIRIDNGNGVINESYGRTIPAPAPDALRAEIPLIQTLAAYYPYNVSITIPTSTARFGSNGATVLVASDYFDILPYTWLAGSPAQSLSSPYSVVLTASRACEYFGDLPAEQYLNHELIYDDSLRVHVTGILKDYEGNTDFPYTDFISFSTISHSFLKDTYRNDQWAFNPAIPRIQAFAKLRENADPVKAAAQFDALLQRHITGDAFVRQLKFSMILQPLDDVHFNERYDHDGIRKAHRPALFGLMGIAIFILLLAIVNFINLSTAQSLRLAKDIGIRRILGASRLRLIGRSLTETGVLTTLSAIIALALVRPALALFRDYLPDGLPFKPFTSANLLFAAGTALLTILLAGLYPAIRLARQPSSHTAQIQDSQRFTLRRVLIVFQFSISLLFIIASIIVGRQIRYMLDADMGFNKTAVVTVSGMSAPQQQVRAFAQRAQRIPGVQEMTMQNHPPAGTATAENPMQLDNRTDNSLTVYMQYGDQQFIPFYQILLLAGRNLLASDSLREFVINDTYRKALGFSKPGDALGHTLTWQGRTHPIVGVVADFHTHSLHTAIPALAIAQFPGMDYEVGLRIALNDHQTLTRLASLWKTLLPDRPFNCIFLDESIARLYKSDQQLSWMVRISTAVAVFISCIGLLGLILFIVERKKKEISIRKVLGAGVGDIVFLLNKEFIVLVGIALVIAGPVAFFGMHRWLQGFAYRVTISWWVFVLAGIITLGISMLTISLRVIRAALINPTDNLRSE